MSIQIFVHTPKAIKRGCPDDRVFIVHNSFKEGRSTWYNAWKCTVSEKGLSHPGFLRPIALNMAEPPAPLQEKLTAARARNGAEPTAQFKKDSLYREITWGELMDRLALAQEAAKAEPPVPPAGSWCVIRWADAPDEIVYMVDPKPTPTAKYAKVFRFLGKKSEVTCVNHDQIVGRIKAQVAHWFKTPLPAITPHYDLKLGC